MDSQSSVTKHDLERMLFDETAEPRALPLSLLREITNGFSDQKEIGKGGFAVVYQGLLVNEKVAVKRLSNTYEFEKEFHREIECLIMAKHKNVVQFLGYCADTQGIMERYEGKMVMVDVQQRLLCFEYLPKGSLDKHITDASRGLDWRNRYNIIKGICHGLHHLHQKNIVHLDLKPGNILLDENFVPKIADFGLSRFFPDMQTRLITANIRGTWGYLAPEFSDGEITYRFDIYSLGVIILEILTGKKSCDDVENVVQVWSNRLETSHIDIQLKQVQICTGIVMECTNFNPAKRPGTQRIIDRLDEAESMDGLIKKGMVTSHQDFSFSGPSNSSLHQMPPEHIPTVIFLALMKISSIIEDSTTNALICKLSGKVTHMKELPVRLREIRKGLKVTSCNMADINVSVRTVGTVKTWIGDARNLAYHIEDAIDKFSYHVAEYYHGGFTKKFFTKGTDHVKVFSKIANDFVEVEKEMQLVLKQTQCLSFSKLSGELTDIEKQGSKESFPEIVSDEDLVGLEENRILLTGWLYSEEPESTVITVSGMGGLGKTTLVSNVYEREKINFPAHAWIVVSRTFTVDALLRKLLWKIGYPEQPLSEGIDKMDCYDLREEIKKRLENRKCLIVLDDVWEQEVYFQMSSTFGNLQGSRIVVTTRKNHVAEISSPTRHLELQPLSKVDAFDLFCRRAFYSQKGHTCPKDLEMIATATVDRCHGLPLAIVTVGSMLSSSQRLDIWEQQCNRLSRELSNNNHVHSIIILAYNDLPDDAQICFLYFSLFPEDHPMSRDILVRLWVAEGFAVSKEGNTAEEVAEANVMELIHRNMLMVVENDELGRVKTCKMHDIVRDVAISIAEEERFASANDYGTIVQTDMDVRRLSLCGWKDMVAPKAKLPHLRTVVAVGVTSYSPVMLSSVLSESRYLTVLELQDSEVTELPASVGSLFNLRYIGLRRTKVKSLPECIENLSNLQTLDIKDTNIQRLPRQIVKIKKLRHLLADRYDNEHQNEFLCFIGVQAPENLSSLEELQTLETVNSSNDLAKKLKKLMQLRSLWIDKINAADCANLFATLSDMPHLSSLFLSASDENEEIRFEALQPSSTNLHRLIIRGQLAKGTLNCPIFLEHGKNLKYLDLSWCHLGEDPVGMLAPHLQNLTYLKLTNMHSANTLLISAGYFPNLKTLVLKHMHDINELKIADGALPYIEGLYVVSLLNLDKIPEGIESLHSLKQLWLLGLHKDFSSHWLKSGMYQKTVHVPEVRVR